MDNTKPKNLSKVTLQGIKSFSFFENFYDYLFHNCIRFKGCYN